MYKDPVKADKNVSDVPTSGAKSKSYSSADHKMMATHLDSAAKLHKEAASYVDAGDADKGNKSGDDAKMHYTKAGEIDKRYTAAQDHETSADHYAQASTHRKEAAMHTRNGDQSKASQSHTNANEHLTKAGEIDKRYTLSNSSNGASNSSQNEKHPQDVDGKFMAKN
jgi:hypothetical protein